MNGWKLMRRILFACDAETAHRLTVFVLRVLGMLPGGRAVLSWLCGVRPPIEGQAAEVWGIRFRNRVGLAAGFDKGGELLGVLPSLGFGFAEVGTVTPRPQSGNERPRLFRDPSRESIFNRMGFNNPGARVVAERIARVRPNLPKDFRVGINIGKNKDTPLEEAANDYEEAVRPFRGLVDYIVVNVSSPNTQGLRSLQTVESLRPIVESVNREIARWPTRPPLLVKLAPEIAGDILMTLLQELPPLGIDGWVLANTLAGTREGQSGGWSGRILATPALDSLRSARTGTRLPIVSVGGIDRGEVARERLQAGAALVQIYSGWIFQGPGLPARIAREVSHFKP